MMRWLLIALIAVTAGCGADGISGGDDAAPPPDGSVEQDAQIRPDAIYHPDASGEVDAPPGCEIAFRFSHSDPGAGDISTYATVYGASDVAARTWTVQQENEGGERVEVSFQTSSPTRIWFHPDRVTPYIVRLEVSGCAPHEEIVIPDGVGTPPGTWWLQITPPNGTSIPPYEDFVSLAASTPSLHFDIPSGVTIGVTLSWLGHQRAPESILRFTPVPDEGRPTLAPVEAYAPSGTARATLARRAHTMLVMPVASVSDAPAPQQITMNMPGTQQLTYVTGDPVGGVVLDSLGDPMVDASISATIAGVPTTLARTDGAGRFTLRTSAMGGGRLTVIPPRGSPYPRLEVAAVMGPNDQIAVRYAPGLRFVDLAGARIRVEQMSVRDASVTLVGAVPGAATATVNGAVNATVTARVHATAVASGTGVLGSFEVPRAALDAVIQAGGSRFAVVRVDLAGAPPPFLDIGPVVELSGAVTGGNLARPLAQVRAVPTGPLAAVTAASASTRTDSVGRFSLEVVAGATYELSVTDPFGAFAEAHRTGVTAGAIGAIALTPGKIVDGTITVGGQTDPDLRGGSVALVCADRDCPVEERGRPVAVGVIGADGAFRLVAPAPPTP